MPDLEYEVYLARKLGRTVEELRATITPREFWAQYTYDARQAAAQKRHLEEAKARRR